MLTDLADALRAGGLTVVEYPRWQARGRPGPFTPHAVMWHHDASAAGDSPGSAHYIAEVDFRDDHDAITVHAPHANCWIDRAGVWHVLAAGKANHAGSGQWGPVPRDQGNQYLVGVETDHTTGEAWPAALLDALRAGTAALMRHYGWTLGPVGHKEYAPTRKVDPDLDMTAERAAVTALLALTTDDLEDEMLILQASGDAQYLVVGDDLVHIPQTSDRAALNATKKVTYAKVSDAFLDAIKAAACKPPAAAGGAINAAALQAAVSAGVTEALSKVFK